ncbi:MAG: hypothetical protein AAF337_09815 [Pseudomonadota bacterium]
MKQNAAAAFSAGLDWVDQGGGVAARHCAALALSAMGKHEAAAELFLEAAEEAANGKGVQLAGMSMTPKLNAALFSQAGHSYVLANIPGKAIDPFTQALEFLPLASPASAVMMADRAQALAMMGNLEAAFTDLTVAIGIVPSNTDVLLLRASAARQTGRLEIAEDDLNALLALREDLATAWMEKGKLALTKNEPTAARKSLMRAIELDDGGDTADAARYLLEELVLGEGAKP